LHFKKIKIKKILKCNGGGESSSQKKCIKKSEDMIRAVCCMHAFGEVGMEVG
jgi:hypothetical protein